MILAKCFVRLFDSSDEGSSSCPLAPAAPPLHKCPSSILWTDRSQGKGRTSGDGAYSRKIPSRMSLIDSNPSTALFMLARILNGIKFNISCTILQFLASKNVHVILQLSASPKLSPLDFWLILRLKQTMKGKTSDTPETIRSNQQTVWRWLQRMSFRCVSASSAKVGRLYKSEGKALEGDQSWKCSLFNQMYLFHQSSNSH